MTLKERALSLIGLERATNRDVLLEELAEVPADRFYDLLADGAVNMAMDQWKCSDCEAAHGGTCPLNGADDDCAMTMGQWLEQPCEHERLLPEVSAP